MRGHYIVINNILQTLSTVANNVLQLVEARTIASQTTGVQKLELQIVSFSTQLFVIS